MSDNNMEYRFRELEKASRQEIDHIRESSRQEIDRIRESSRQEIDRIRESSRQEIERIQIRYESRILVEANPENNNPDETDEVNLEANNIQSARYQAGEYNKKLVPKFLIILDSDAKSIHKIYLEYLELVRIVCKNRAKRHAEQLIKRRENVTQ